MILAEKVVNFYSYLNVVKLSGRNVCHPPCSKTEMTPLYLVGKTIHVQQYSNWGGGGAELVNYIKKNNN